MSKQTKWYIEIHHEDGTIREVPLDRDELLIGRSENAEIQLDRHSISRSHANIVRRADGGWRLVDLGSRGGTKINGRVVGEMDLEPGDTISISRFRLRLIRECETTELMATDGPQVKIDDAPPIEVSILDQIKPPHIDTSQIAALSDFGKELIEQESPTLRLDLLCQIVTGRVVPAKWAMVLRLDPADDAIPPQEIAFAPPDMNGRDDIHVSGSLIKMMRSSGSPVLGSNMGGGAMDGARGSVEISVISHMAPTSAVACPLVQDDGHLDCLYVSLPPVYGTTEWLALVALAVKQYQQAEAIWMIRKASQIQAAIERDLENAKQIQISLLPREVEISDLDIAWSYDPCESIGGDYIDVVPMKDGRTLLVIADVTGHGLPAALTTLSLHSIVHIVLRQDTTLAQMVDGLNDHLCEFLPGGRFVTMMFIALDTKTGKLECINCGHGATVLMRPDGSSRSLQLAVHMPLGLMPAEYQIQTDRLESDELLCMMTDGMSEMMNADGKMIGVEGVIELIENTYTEFPSGLCQQHVDHLCSELDHFAGYHAVKDDRTVLMARRKN
jgi:sigma-B regulation protein RsbU (phosphoserine phosphatase)